MSAPSARGARFDLTMGPVTGSMLLFAAPMIAGNLLQQLYNVADTFIVGRFLGADALAAVGASYAAMVFLTSVLLGLCMGGGVLFSMLYGAGETDRMKQSFVLSFAFIAALTAVIEALALAGLPVILRLLQIPDEVFAMTGEYLRIIFYGLPFTFLYNYFASLLRAVGRSAPPLVFLAVSSVLNIALDLLVVLRFEMGVAGAAWATIAAQGVSALCAASYCAAFLPQLRPQRRHMRFDASVFRQLAQYSLLTCAQQSVMNFGILMVQGLVNSFGVTAMAAFAAGVKIDSLAYMPVQDFGNAFATFIAQNKGAGRHDRIRAGLKSAVACAVVFCLVISAIVFFCAQPLMRVFVDASETAVIGEGVLYLRIEGACYCGIGCLFLFYGLYRGLGRAGFSLVLTVVSLGTRVALAYLLAPRFGLPAVWWAIPIGWLLADVLGAWKYRSLRGEWSDVSDIRGAYDNFN